MNAPRDFDLDLVLTQWLEDTASPHPVEYLGDVLRVTSATRQRPRWSFPRRWLPFDVPARPHGRPIVLSQTAWLVLLLAAVLSLVIGNLTAQNIRRLPPPFGIARPGLVAFDSDHRIAVTNPDGSGFRLLSRGPGADTAPVWSPDGTRLAFWWITQDGRRQIIVADDSGSVRAQVTIGPAPPILATDDPGWDSIGYALGAPSFLSWSPDSRRILFSKATGATPGIWVVDADGSGLRQLGDPAIPAEEPVWSWDGTRVAFHGGMGRTAAENGIYVMRADGTEVRQVSHVVAADESFNYPQWQPGGELILFFANPGGEMRVFTVRSDGSGERVTSTASLGANVSDWNPFWSPDGSRIAFKRISDDHQSGQIVVMDADGSHLFVPADQPTDLGGPVWSPDGREVGALLYGKDNTGASYGLVFFDLSGTRPPRITSALDNTGGSSWQRLAP